MKRKSLKPLAITFFVSGIWDTIAAIQYLFVIGTGRKIDNPDIEPFYAIFLGSFFLCFAYLQFLSAFNIKRYVFNVGCLVFGRIFYVIQLYVSMVFVADFPNTFAFTGIIDISFVLLYIIFAQVGGLKLSELFVPKIAG
ncbi:MAG: hypothetical protein KQH79_10095 [Bacteroidetes bacterium]|nr:hypothetical protein [Bacteroidota bacterium]